MNNDLASVKVFDGISDYEFLSAQRRVDLAARYEMYSVATNKNSEPLAVTK